MTPETLAVRAAQVCAQWVPDVRVARSGACAVVEGVASLPQDRWGVPCSLCGSAMGVVLRCNAGHCSLPFHALCARNAGLYLAARGDPGKAQTFRAYCAQHSAGQRRKDAEASGEVRPASQTLNLCVVLRASLILALSPGT